MAGQGGQNKVMGMEKIITKKSGQAPVAHFVSGFDECEKKTVVWEIRNIAELLKMSTENLKNNGITFEAGHSIGIPATWYFYLTRIGVGHNATFLKLSPDSKVKLAKASCTIALSYGGTTTAFGELKAHEFKNPEMGLGSGRAWPLETESDILEKTGNGREALKVSLIVKVFSSKDSVSVKIPKAKLLKPEAEDVISDFVKLLDSGESVGADSADVNITVPKVAGGEMEMDATNSVTKKVHKCILMARSTVFAKMFSKESEMVEAKTGKVVIKDLSPQGLGVFLHYIYTGKVLDEWVKFPEEILNCAEKYNLGRLKQFCGRNLMAAVSTKNAWDMYHLAKLHKLSFAKKAIAEFVSKNAKAVLDGDDDDDDDGPEEEDDTDTDTE